MKQLLGLLLVLVVFSVHPRAAWADDDSVAAAKEHYVKGTRAFELGKYDEAIVEYEAAYRAKDDPVLLYNLGQAHRLANHPVDALRFYKMFVLKVPKANNKQLRDKISSLERLIEEQKKSQNVPPDTTVPPGRTPVDEPDAKPSSKPDTTVVVPAPSDGPTVGQTPPPPEVAAAPSPPVPGRTKKIVGFVVAGVGVACIGGAIGAGVVAKNDAHSVSSTAKAGGVFDPSKQSGGKSADIAQGVLYGVGIAAVITGTVVAVLGYREAKAAASTQALHIEPLVSPQLAGLSLRWNF